MSKRTAENAGLDVKVFQDKRGVTDAPRREMQGSGADGKKHSMDSDDEDEYAVGNTGKPELEKLGDDEIEGQEDFTIERDGDISITPFNLKEEQEEGHFSKDGNFVWKKEKEIVDSWLDNVDWVKVKRTSADEAKLKEQMDDEEDEAALAYNEITAYKECLKLMCAGETVAKAIRRLAGGGKPGAKKKWQNKKKKLETESEEQKLDRERMKQLSGYADSILSRSGNMEIYDETYEKIAYKIKEVESAKIGRKTIVSEDVGDDDALDMFADNLDAVGKRVEDDEKRKESEALVLDNDVRWEYKWSIKEDEKIHGPHSSEEMHQWKDSGFFDKGVFVRKAGTNGDFSDGRRIDFELYT